jgi:hypothetical protein
LSCNPWPVDTEVKEQLPAKRFKYFSHLLEVPQPGLVRTEAADQVLEEVLHTQPGPGQ